MLTLPLQSESMKVFIGEADLWDGLPTYQAIAKEARRRGMAGVTVIRGMVGFGAASHEPGLPDGRLSVDAPIIIEIVDSREQIGLFLADFRDMLKGCLVTIQPVRVLMYQAEPNAASADLL